MSYGVGASCRRIAPLDPLPTPGPMLRLLVPAAVALVALAATSDVTVASFSTMRPGGDVAGFEALQFNDADPTDYALVTEDGRTVVRADADDSAGGLVRRIDIDPAATPILSWSWKVENVLQKGDVRRKSGDDYPARLYITFDYDPSDLSFGDRIKYRALKLLGYGDIPVRALNYIWANNANETAIVENPYTDWVQMVPVQSGADGLGAWQTERRNVLDDYRAAFGEDPPAINAIAIMTDGDNTGEAATAYYGDIRMSAR